MKKYILLACLSLWLMMLNGCGNESTAPMPAEIVPSAPPPVADATAARPPIQPKPLDMTVPTASPVDAEPPQEAMIVVDAQVVDAMTPDMQLPDAAAPEPVLRFVALGDTGKANDGQRRVAEAMIDACEEFGGCGFGIILGDVIYDSGVDGPDDEQWGPKFEEPYANVPFPFYITLGNHDYGAPPILQSFAGGIGIDPTRGQAQIDYARTHDNFILPDSFYRFVEGPIEFVSLNTTTLFWRDLSWIEEAVGFSAVNERQRETLPRWAAESVSPWRIAFGHHPYLSNGQHGNAGTYDGVLIPGLVGSGSGLKEFFEEHVIGEFDVYLCGHDHNLQDLGNEKGTELIVSGAGASAKGLNNNRDPSPAQWQVAELGFFIIEATRDRLVVHGITVNEGEGPQRLWNADHERVIQRPTP